MGTSTDSLHQISAWSFEWIFIALWQLLKKFRRDDVTDEERGNLLPWLRLIYKASKGEGWLGLLWQFSFILVLSSNNEEPKLAFFRTARNTSNLVNKLSKPMFNRLLAAASQLSLYCSFWLEKHAPGEERLSPADLLVASMNLLTLGDASARKSVVSCDTVD